jgi:hypothetical protein
MLSGDAIELLRSLNHAAKLDALQLLISLLVKAAAGEIDCQNVAG